LLSASRNPQKFRAIAVKAPDDLSEQAAMLDDLAIMTGGRMFIRAAGDTPSGVDLDHLGKARRAWADGEYFGVVRGKGDPRRLRAHVRNLSAACTATEDLDERKKLRARLGKMMGGAATLWAGGISEVEINTRKELAERTIETLRSALGKGILPGGGASLVACGVALDRLIDRTEDENLAVAYRILSRALQEPVRTLLVNAGIDPSPTIARMLEAGPGYGFDARRRAIVPMAEAGILDPAGVLISAVHEAVASAALALSVDVLVHHKKPETAVNP
jgi:chaperonin GroEL